MILIKNWPKSVMMIHHCPDTFSFQDNKNWHKCEAFYLGEVSSSLVLCYIATVLKYILVVVVVAVAAAAAAAAG